MARVIIGTAGHIDHGKSALVRALTGTDPDRLPEEKHRGITIDLGYAFLAGVAAIIDVPGHEKFIRNMVAGAATVDFALLVVAADDGVMPQTREHLHILRLLGLQAGAIVITKIDKVEPDWLELVEEQIVAVVQGTFLADARIFRADSLSGKGIAELRDYLIRTLSTWPSRSDRGVLRLPIDRVFTIKGRGVIVTGSMLSGRVRKDDKVTALPANLELRLKHLESEGHDADVLEAGQRSALNLVGETERLERGLTITQPNALLSSARVKVVIELLPGIARLKDRQRIRFLIATQEIIGRVQLLSADSGKTYANILLEEEAVAVWGDHFVLRRYSPLETLGGGVVLEPDAPPLRTRFLEREHEFARALDVSSLSAAAYALLRYRGEYGLSASYLAALLGMPRSALADLWRDKGADQVHEFGEYLLLDEHLRRLGDLLVSRLTDLHSKQKDIAGFAESEVRAGELSHIPLPLFQQVTEHFVRANRIARDGAMFRLPAKRIELTPAQSELVSRMRDVISTEGFAPSSSSVLAEKLGKPKPEVEKALVLMERLGYARRLGLDLFFDASAFDSAVSTLEEQLRAGRELSVSDVSQALNSSRKYVVPLLEYLDSKGITQRQGNVRVPGRNLAVAEQRP